MNDTIVSRARIAEQAMQAAKTGDDTNPYPAGEAAELWAVAFTQYTLALLEECEGSA